MALIKSKQLENNKIASGYRLLFGYLGIFLIMLGIIFLVPLASLLFDKSDVFLIQCFMFSSAITIFIGTLLYLFIYKKQRGSLRHNQEMVLIVLIWLCFSFFGALPFLFNKTSFTNAIFESISGFTSTGLTVLNAKTELPKIFLLYRSLTELIGGIGLVLVITSAISSKHGFLLYQAEGHSNQFIPNLAKGSRLILVVYLYFVLIGTLLYVSFGMSLFDGINHAMAAVSTGGFSTKINSIAEYNNISFEIISIVLMTLGATSFFVFIGIVRGDFSKLFKNSEMHYSLISFLCIFLPCLIYILISKDLNANPKDILFQYTSSRTTTGFQSVVSISDKTPQIIIFVMIINMLVGGQIGSTTGGVKHYRLVYIFKGLSYSIRKFFRNERTVRTHYIDTLGQRQIFSDEEYHKHLSLVLLFIFTFLIGAAGLMFCGEKALPALFESASALGTTGLSLGVTRDGAVAQLWILNILMLLGRLEILPFITGSNRLIKDIFKPRHKKIIFND